MAANSSSPAGWLLVLIAAFALGCGINNPTPNQEQATTSFSPNRPAISRVDKSLTPDEYVALGMPRHDREWTASDLAKVAEVLTKLAASDPTKLPRYNSPRSGVVFARIVIPLKPLVVRKDGPATPEVQVRAMYLKAWMPVRSLYLDACENGVPLDIENVELIGWQLQNQVSMVKFFVDYVATLENEALQNEVLIGAFERSKASNAKLILGAVMSLERLVVRHI